MKLHVALFFAGLFGALATLFILLSFGTDYWLLASETCNSHVNGPATLQVGGSVVSIPLGQREKWTSVLLIWIVLLVLVNYQKTRFRDGLFINMKQVSSELYILDFSVNWSKILKRSWAYLVYKQWLSYDILKRHYLQSLSCLSVDYHML